MTNRRNERAEGLQKQIPSQGRKHLGVEALVV
jgi:hypothetical protein